MIGHPPDAASLARKRERRTASALRASALLIIIGIAGVVFVGAHKPSLANELGGTPWVFKPETYRILLIGSWGLIVLAALNAVDALVRRGPDIRAPAAVPATPASDVVPAARPVAPPEAVPARAAPGTPRTRRAALLAAASVIVVLLVVGGYVVGRTTRRASAPQSTALRGASTTSPITANGAPPATVPTTANVNASLTAAAETDPNTGFNQSQDTLTRIKVVRGWAMAVVSADDPADMGNEDIIFRESQDGAWAVVAYGSSFTGSGVPANVLRSLA